MSGLGKPQDIVGKKNLHSKNGATDNGSASAQTTIRHRQPKHRYTSPENRKKVEYAVDFQVDYQAKGIAVPSIISSLFRSAVTMYILTVTQSSIKESGRAAKE